MNWDFRGLKCQILKLSRFSQWYDQNKVWTCTYTLLNFLDQDMSSNFSPTARSMSVFRRVFYSEKCTLQYFTC